MMLVIVGLLLVPFPADSNADILVPADSVAVTCPVSSDQFSLENGAGLGLH